MATQPFSQTRARSKMSSAAPSAAQDPTKPKTRFRHGSSEWLAALRKRAKDPNRKPGIRIVDRVIG